MSEAAPEDVVEQALPAGRYDEPAPVRTVVPVKNRLRRKVGWLWRNRATAAVNSTSGWSALSQWTHEIFESWA